MSATSKRAGGGAWDPSTVLVWVLITVVLVGGGVTTAALHLGNGLSATPQTLPANPFVLVLGLAQGDVEWPTASTVVLGVLGLLVVLLAVLVGLRVARRAGRSTRVDGAARHMGAGRDVAALSRRGAAATASRLGVTDGPGLPLGTTMGGQSLFSSWEDVSVDIWGPRTGKTTSRAIPAILAAPGPVVATSNKRDLVDATRGPRAEAGEVWVFDPQGIVDEPATWWWNPLDYVVDEVHAARLARLFAAAARAPGARTDAYFDTAATGLLGNLLLAAALDGRPVTQVYLWLTDPTDDEPAEVLRARGWTLQAAAVDGVVHAPERQRGGVYGTALEVVSFLTSRQAATWVTPQPGRDHRPQFDPEAFVAGPHTLYSLSKEGEGSTGPLVTALTVAVTEAAEALAKTSPGGRLAVPMVAVLDEAANVCRWKDLPDLYSHYGSRGITILTILQSWSQGVEVWGRDGMRKLWSAANVKVYGGGVSETEFLGELSQLVGDFTLATVSTSHGRNGRTASRSTRQERVLSVADLAGLPKGRAVVFASGAPATMIRTVPWMDGPHAPAIAASIAGHDPGARDTLADARAAAGRAPACVAGTAR